MITEDYVSFETAKLLKEKGFDGECRDYYNTDGHFYSEDFSSNWNDPRSPVLQLVSSPTIQMAMKWLLKKHRIFISICPNLNEELIDGNHTGMHPKILYSFNVGQWGDDGWQDIQENSNYKEYCTYEEAREAAIKYCLENLI